MVVLGYRPPSVREQATAEVDALVAQSRKNAGRTGTPVGSQVTVDSVLHHVSKNPGSSTGGYKVLRKVWIATCSVVSGAVSQCKGVSIPGFCAFSVQKKRKFKGTWGEKIELLPSFVLHPTFSQTFGIRYHGPSVQAAHLGTAACDPINFVSVSIQAGYSKDVCASAVKDIWRKFGELAAKGAAFSVDFGIARLVLQSRSCEVHWNTAFLEQLEAHCNQYNGTKFKYWTTSPLASAAGDSQKVYKGKGMLPMDVAPEEGEELAARKVATVQHARPATVAGHGFRDPGEVARPMRAASPTPKAQPETKLPHVQGEGAVGEDKENPQTRAKIKEDPAKEDVKEYSGALPVNATDRNEDQRTMSAVRSQLNDALHYARTQRSVADSVVGTNVTYNERHRRRLRNKTLYRRLRSKAYANAWEEQRQVREELKKKEREKDLERLSVWRQRAAMEDASAQEELMQRRRLAKEVQDHNSEMASSRPRQRWAHPDPPEMYQWGALAESRTPRPSISEELQKLEEQKARKKQEKQEENQRELEELRRQQQQWEEEEEQERKQMKERQQELVKQYHKQLSKPKMDSKQEFGGNFFFKSKSAEEMLEEERLEKRLKREAALEVMRANQQCVERLAAHRRIARGVNGVHERKRFDKSVRRVQVLEEQDEEMKREQNAMLRAAWDKQVQEREAGKRREREQKMSKAVTVHAWRNESSDEEYDNFPSHALSSHTSLRSPSTRQGH